MFYNIGYKVTFFHCEVTLLDNLFTIMGSGICFYRDAIENIGCYIKTRHDEANL